MKEFESESIRERILKVKKLMESGATYGERISAMQALNRLLGRYGLTLDDIKDQDSEPKETYWFKFRSIEERELVFQIFAKITGECKIKWFTNRYDKKVCGFDLTKVQGMEMERLIPAYMEQYRVEMRREMRRVKKTLFMAFISKHGLFGNSSDSSSENETTLSNADIARIKQLILQMDDIVLPHKRLTQGGRQ